MTQRGSSESGIPAGSPADRARWIIEHPRDGSYGDGQRIVELLLAGREAAALSPDELDLLARGYNWWGQHALSAETALLALARTPQSVERLQLAGLHVRNGFGGELSGFIQACDRCITEGLGPAAFWHLLKADAYLARATGEDELEDFEWSPGDPILHPEWLQPASQALEAALLSGPELTKEGAPEWVGDWSTRFAAVLRPGKDPTP